MFIPGEESAAPSFAPQSPKPAVRCHEFDGQTIEISGVQAKIEIEASSEPRIAITLSGPRAIVNHLEVDEMSGTVFIAGPRFAEVGRLAFMLQIRAPIGTNVRLSGIADKASIIDLDGDLWLDLVGPSDVCATKVNNLDIKAAGETNVTIGSIRGDAAIRIKGSSRVNLQQGTTGRLQIMTLDSCCVDAQVTAQEADLDAFDASAIRVKAVVEHCERAYGGTGLIGIG